MEHSVETSFRWVVLVEFFLSAIFLLILLPFILWAFIQSLFEAEWGGGSSDGGSERRQRSANDDATRPRRERRHAVEPSATWFQARLFHFRHAVTVNVADGRGHALATRRVHPRSATEGEALVASIIDSARHHGLMVLERIVTPPPEIVSRWAAGHPVVERTDGGETLESLEAEGFLVPVQDETEARAVATERGAVRTVRRTSEALELVEHDAPLGRLESLLHLLAAPLFVVTSGASEAQRTALSGLMGLFRIAPGHTKLVVGADGVRLLRRQWFTSEERFLPRSEVLGAFVGPALDYDRRLSRHRHALRVVGRTRTLWIAMNTPEEVLLGAITRELARHAPPSTDVETLCPYCATRFVFASGIACPQCGAWPQQFVGLQRAA